MVTLALYQPRDTRDRLRKSRWQKGPGSQVSGQAMVALLAVLQKTMLRQVEGEHRRRSSFQALP
jgi:hypothetical protein